MTQPWYPASWLDADGKPLPDVRECTPGEWPPCKPDDEVQRLTAGERFNRLWECNGIVSADTIAWSGDVAAPWTTVAIRIIEGAS